MSIQDSLQFISETQLPSNEDLAELLQNIHDSEDVATPADTIAASADNTISAQVNAGSLTSFTQNLSGQSKSDVMNSTLFAQLASNCKCNRFEEPMKWYLKYTEVLGMIGWSQPGFAFDEYTSGGTTVRLDKAVLAIIAEIASPSGVALVEATMKCLGTLPGESKQMKIWNSNGKNGNKGNFQIFPVDKLPNGDVVMILDGMQFNASTSHGGFLWWSWKSNNIKIQRAASKFVLNEEIYSRVRQAIIEKLGDLASELVANIPIK